MKRHNTIEDIEQVFWGDAPPDTSHLTTTCHNLRKKNLDEFTAENYRILIGQDIALEILIPQTLVLLKENIFTEGDFYEGDLLKNVLTSDKNFWKIHPDYKREIIELFEKNIISLGALETTYEIRNELMSAFHTFKTE